jgi:hypothetical protein
MQADKPTIFKLKSSFIYLFMSVCVYYDASTKAPFQFTQYAWFAGVCALCACMHFIGYQIWCTMKSEIKYDVKYQSRARTRTHTQTQKQTQTQTHTYAHTHIHTHTHTHAYKHTHTHLKNMQHGDTLPAEAAAMKVVDDAAKCGISEPLCLHTHTCTHTYTATSSTGRQGISLHLVNFTTDLVPN